MNKLRFVICLLLLFGGLAFVSCDDDDEKIKVGSPDVIFNSETGEYKVKIGKEVLLEVSVKEAESPLYAWKLDGKIVSTDSTYWFKGEQIGDYFVNFKMNAENGSVEKQVKVSVLDKLPPEVSLPEMMVAMSGREQVYGAELRNAGDASYTWILDGNVVGHDSLFIFKQETRRIYDLSLVVENEDGKGAASMFVTVIPVTLPRLIFSDGRYRAASDDRVVRYSVPLGRELVLSPYTVEVSGDAVYEWTVDGTRQGEASANFKFVPAAKGTYHVTVRATDGSATASTEAYVECVDPEGTHFREIGENSSARFTEVFEYLPAPGQFVNFAAGSTMADVLAKGKTILDPSTAYLSLGAYGGYVVLGFDHSVKNVEGEFDLILNGNPMDTWSEPGVVWVMQDENGDGLPNDTWYELKGSASKKEMMRKYVLTYYYPTADQGGTLWSDNYGKAGSVEASAYHGQGSSFPKFMTEDFMMFGTCLASKVGKQGGIIVCMPYDWGYVDNKVTGGFEGFKIDNAIQVDGTPVKLDYIDFVMIQTSVNDKAGILGEISTELLDGYDYHLKNK